MKRLVVKMSTNPQPPPPPQVPVSPPESGLVEYDYGDLSDLNLDQEWPNLQVPLSPKTVAELKNLRY